jgi:hypothetical protein
MVFPACLLFCQENLIKKKKNLIIQWLNFNYGRAIFWPWI